MTYVFSTLAAPGVIEISSPFRRIVFGSHAGANDDRVTAISEALTAAGVETTVTDDPQAAVWQKYVMQAPNAMITSACRASVGAVRDTPEGAGLIERE